MRKIIISLIVLLISACSAQNVDTGGNLLSAQIEGEYSILIPFEASSIRSYHGTYLSKADRIEVGSRLLEKTKSVFDPSVMFISEGQILSMDDLSKLVKRESSENPYGLNPPSGSSFVVNDSGASIENAVVVADVVEVDFYTGSNTKPVLSGIAFTIVLNGSIKDASGSTITIDENRLYAYGSDMGRKLERYIRTISNLEDIPVYIALYSTQSLDASLPGHYIGEGLFDGRSGQFSQNTESWFIFPSNAAANFDPKTDASFSRFKAEVADFVPDALGVIAQGRYEEDGLNHLVIEIQLQAKTFTEIYALSYLVMDLLSQFESGDYDIIVKINDIDENLALISQSEDGKVKLIINQ